MIKKNKKKPGVAKVVPVERVSYQQTKIDLLEKDIRKLYERLDSKSNMLRLNRSRHLREAIDARCKFDSAIQQQEALHKNQIIALKHRIKLLMDTINNYRGEAPTRAKIRRRTRA